LLGVGTVSIFLYFLYPIALISFSVYTSRNREVSGESYFFANRNVHWLELGASLFATSLFGPYIFGFASSGLSSGVPVVYAVVSIIMLAVLGGFFAPRYMKMKIKTLPEFFERRFDKKCRRFLSTLYIVTNVAFRLLIILTLGRIFLSSVGGVDVFSSLLFFLVVTGIYVIIGGLQAEIHANLLQVFLILVAIIGLTLWLLSQGNGVGQAVQKIVSPFDLSRMDDSEFTRAGVLLGLPIVGFWFWCADQFMVQKTLTARDVPFVRKASLTAGVLQIVPVLIFILPGLAVPFSGKSEPEGFLRLLFSNALMPDSLRALLVIGAVAAFMIAVATVLNGTSSLITFDFFCSIRPEASERQVVLVGRMTTMVLVLVSILMIPVSQAMNLGLCIQLLKIFSYFVSMVAAIFIMGLLNHKIGGTSAFFALMAGTVVILLRVILQMVLGSHQLETGLFSWFVQSDFLVFSIFVFLLSLALLVIFDFPRLRYQPGVRRTRHSPEGVQKTAFLSLTFALAAIDFFLMNFGIGI
jgi:SSS family solute:Na+ symporter